MSRFYAPFQVSISGYSVAMGAFWFTICGLLIYLLMKHSKKIGKYGVPLVCIFAVLAIFRMLVPIEHNMMVIIPADTIYSNAINFLKMPLPFWNIDWAVGYIMLIIWFSGTIICFLRLGIYLAKDFRTISALQKSTEENLVIERTFRDVVQSKRCALVISPQVPTPMTAGFFRPVILLPQSANQLSTETLCHIFMHEWHHIKSKDIWVKLLLRCLCCFLWWNPIVYLLEKIMTHLLELRCDTSVIKDMKSTEKKRYLHDLLVVLNVTTTPVQQNKTVVCYTGVREDFAIRQRFVSVLQYEEPNKVILVTAIIIMCLCLIASYAFTVQPSGDYTGIIENEIILTPENSYIVAREDGTYYVTYHGEYFTSMEPIEFTYEPYCDLPVKCES